MNAKSFCEILIPPVTFVYCDDLYSSLHCDKDSTRGRPSWIRIEANNLVLGCNLFDLLRRCLEEDDADAWGDFWILYQHVVPNGVAAILSPAGFNAADVEDVAMDTYVRLAEADHRRLRTFRGDTAPQLIQWLRRLAVNSARDWLRTTASCRTRQLVEGGQFVTARDQCSAQKVEIALSELERSGNGDDIKKLRMISGLEILPDSISSRTVRHWCQTLCQRYASQLQHC